MSDDDIKTAETTMKMQGIFKSLLALIDALCIRLAIAAAIVLAALFVGALCTLAWGDISQAVELISYKFLYIIEHGTLPTK